MVPILYEDKDIIVVHKPAGLESQSSRGFAPDMVSEISCYLHNPQDIHKPAAGISRVQPPYVGVIHRLDKPVQGVMVYAKNQKSAAALSAALQAGKMEKSYMAVICGQLVDKQGSYVDYLRQDRKNNTSEIVDKSVKDAKKAVLKYREMEVIHSPEDKEQMVSLIDIELLTGRHHQIRVQFAGHATPLYGDERYGGGLSTKSTTMTVDRGRKKGSFGDAHRLLALCARRLAFPHPSTGKIMEFSMVPSSGAFAWFPDRARKLISQSECDKCHKEI